MNFRVTTDIFSGRKNPVLEIKGREASRFYEHLRPARRLSARVAAAMDPLPLGYCGLIVEPGGGKGLPKSFRVAGGDLFGGKLSHRAADEDVELFLAGNKALLRKLRLGDRFPGYLLKEVDRY